MPGTVTDVILPASAPDDEDEPLESATARKCAARYIIAGACELPQVASTNGAVESSAICTSVSSVSSKSGNIALKATTFGETAGSITVIKPVVTVVVVSA